MIFITAVLPGVVDVEDDEKLKLWLRIILSALKNHISEPAVQVIYYVAPPTVLLATPTQAVACHCLTQMLVSRPDAIRWIGSDPNGQL